jgi:hypothetical protein
MKPGISVPASILLYFICCTAFSMAEFKDIPNNFDSSLRFKLAAYAQKPGASVVPDIIIQDASRTIEVKYDWNTWFETGGNTHINLAGWLEYGMPDDHRWAGTIELFQDTDHRSRPIMLNEVYATIPAGNMDLVIGRAIQRNTVSILYPLADRYIARDFNDPTDSKILGVWQARADYYCNDWQCSLALLPIFQPPKLPDFKSRWWLREIEPVIGTSIPAGATGRVEQVVGDVSLENTGVLATLRTQQQGWDFFTSAYHGPSSYGVFRTASPSPTDFLVTVEYIKGFDVSAGLSTVLDTVEVHAETLYHDAYSGKDDDYINGLVGCIWRPALLAEWMHCNQVHLTAEYAAEHIFQEQATGIGLAGSSEPFRIGRNTLFTECLAEITAKDMASVAYIHDFEEKNAFFQLRGGHRFSNGLRMELVGEIFAGSDLYFGTWNNNDRIYLNVEYHY